MADNSAPVEDDLSLPRAGVNKMIKEVIPMIRVSNDARELVLNCCTEFIHLIASEANEICNKQTKKTISPEHVIQALESLGFHDYVKDVEGVYEQFKKQSQTRKKNNKLKNQGVSEEELLRQQQELIAKARAEQAQEEWMHHMQQQQQQFLAAQQQQQLQNQQQPQSQPLVPHSTQPQLQPQPQQPIGSESPMTQDQTTSQNNHFTQMHMQSPQETLISPPGAVQSGPIPLIPSTTIPNMRSAMDDFSNGNNYDEEMDSEEQDKQITDVEVSPSSHDIDQTVETAQSEPSTEVEGT